MAEFNQLKVLAGKRAALASVVAVAVAATLAGVGIGVLLASAGGVGTAAWWTAEGPAANALATGGAAGMSMAAARPATGYATPAILALGYGIVSVAISSAVLARRDVTS